ncbi:hypothetical protein D915_000948 [Fasciola hepatica]|uniref:Uncharacterized protein n=1 Tax=Fasciola hepatica TaxID=6192 RepID=A0A4E0RQV5_FASHE|nr:hypothetical protein D915_000948 [Fasciola hepatica]
MSGKSGPRISKPCNSIESEWPHANQLHISKDSNSDNVKLALNWTMIPPHVRPRCPACGCRQIRVECCPINVDYETLKEKEQRDSYLGYLKSFNSTCICEQAKASRIVPIVPCGEPVACTCKELNRHVGAVPTTNGPEGYCLCCSKPIVPEPSPQPPRESVPMMSVSCGCCLPQMDDYYTPSW